MSILFSGTSVPFDGKREKGGVHDTPVLGQASLGKWYERSGTCYQLTGPDRIGFTAE